MNAADAVTENAVKNVLQLEAPADDLESIAQCEIDIHEMPLCADAPCADAKPSDDAVAVVASQPPYKDGDNPADGLQCYFPGCPYKGDSWFKIMEHLRTRHGVSRKSLRGTYLHTMGKDAANAQFRKTYKEQKQSTTKKPKANAQSRARKAKVDVRAHGGEDAGGTVNTDDAQPSTPVHADWTVATIKLLTTLDTRANEELQKGDPNMKFIESLFAQATLMRDQLIRVQQLNAQTAPLPRSPKIAPAADTQPQSNATQPLHKLKICQDALNYRKPSEDDVAADTRRRRFTWPCKLQDHSVVLTEVERHVRHATKKKGIADAYIGGIKQFFSIFECPADRNDPVDVFQALYRDKLISDAMDLDLLHPSLTSTRRITDGLNVLIDFVVLVADDTDNAAVAKSANACKVRFIKPLRKKLADEKENQRARREKLDTVRLANLPSIPSRNEAAQRAMFDIAVVHAACAESYAATRTIENTARRFLNSAAYGISAYRTFLGRSGEWKRMQRSSIIACTEDASCSMILITDHKTKRTCGILGRYMPDDVKWAFKNLTDFGDASQDLLYVPLSTSKYVQISKLGCDFASMYTPGKTEPEPTLMRKDCETAISDPANAEQASRMNDRVKTSDGADGAKKKAAEMSGHSEKTQDKYYNLNAKNPREHAESARAYIEEFLGPTLVPPTQEVIAANAGRTAEIILQEFKDATRRIARNGTKLDDDDGADTEDSEDGEEDEDVHSEDDATENSDDAENVAAAKKAEARETVAAKKKEKARKRTKGIRCAAAKETEDNDKCEQKTALKRSKQAASDRDSDDDRRIVFPTEHAQPSGKEQSVKKALARIETDGLESDSSGDHGKQRVYNRDGHESLPERELEAMLDAAIDNEGKTDNPTLGGARHRGDIRRWIAPGSVWSSAEKPRSVWRIGDFADDDSKPLAFPCRAQRGSDASDAIDHSTARGSDEHPELEQPRVHGLDAETSEGSERDKKDDANKKCKKHKKDKKNKKDKKHKKVENNKKEKKHDTSKKEKKQHRDSTDVGDVVLSADDDAALEQEGMKARDRGGDGLIFTEKEYLVKVIRKIQRGRADHVPVKAELTPFINSANMDGTFLKRHIDDLQYYNKVRNFVQHFMKIAQDASRTLRLDATVKPPDSEPLGINDV